MIKDIKEFIVEYIRVIKLSDGTFGHFPTFMFTESKKGNFAMGESEAGDAIEDSYMIANTLGQAGASRVYFSLDFAPLMDIETNFILMHSLEIKKSNRITFFAIPYSKETGEMYPWVFDGKAVKALGIQYLEFVMAEMEESCTQEEKDFINKEANKIIAERGNKSN